MPLLGTSSPTEQEERKPLQRRGRALFPVCANAKCSSGWLHVWRSHSTPIIEGGWTCSYSCTRARIAELVHRERTGHTQTAGMHRHRVPIGLVLLTEGWISRDDLRRGLSAQKAGEAVRLGTWLIKHCGLEERRVTQALSIQWNCPILPIDREHKTPVISAVPRLFLETFGCLPLRSSATGILYIAFDDRIDHSLTLAIERMSGLRVESGLIDSSEFRSAHRSILAARFPRARMVEASGIEAMVDALTAIVEREKPFQTRIVRVHGFYWLRVWKEPTSLEPKHDISAPKGVEDVISSLTHFQ